jgi:hypothetical protein
MPDLDKIHRLPVKDLKPNKWGPKVNQPMPRLDMDALYASIEADGVQIPLVVWKRDGNNVVVSGNTRLKIATLDNHAPIL